MKLLDSTALAASLLAVQVIAATTTSLPNLSSAAATQGTNTKATNTNTNAATTSVASPTVVITGGSSAAVITVSASSTTDDGALTGLPTLTGGFVIVAPSVPPTANAPFMQTSKLPEGTVFIAVGAILGFLAMSVVLWRTLTAWSLHRSVKRAVSQQNMSDTKTLFGKPAGPPPAPFYGYSDRDSTLSLSGLAPKGKARGRPSTSHTPGASTSNLFFSPTAGAAGAGLSNPGNRGSNYLPAGYYAAGASAAGNGQNHVPLGAGHGPAISLSNLGPQSHGYSRAKSVGPSPPDSPAFVATTGAHMASNSTLDLNRNYGQQRPPSSYLDDMFDHEAPPVPNHHNRTDSGSSRRY